MVIGVKIEKIWDNVSIGGGVNPPQKCPNLNLVVLKTEGGSVFFQKYQLFDSVVCNITFIRNV